MGEKTGIAWCDHTHNPWWGCEKISPACKNCYAATFDARFAGNDPHWGPGSSRKFFGDKHWNEPRKWNRAAEAAMKPRRVFCASMADVFEDRPDLVEPRRRLWDLIVETPWLYWLLLTKRPENIRSMAPSFLQIAGDSMARMPTNVWIGTTIESQEYMWRADHLLMVKASVHFLSCEPLLSDLDLGPVLRRRLVTHDGRILDNPDAIGEGGTWRFAIDQVITGCESGHGARPQNVEWYRSLRNQTLAAGKAFFLKQAEPEVSMSACASSVKGIITKGPGSWVKAREGIIEQPYLDGVQHIDFPKGHLDR